MKQIKLLTRKKGFSLAECIVALAVFAVLTSMVLMIMSSTVNLSKKASDNEEDLNTVVQNVVMDDTNKVYGNDSNTFAMVIGDASYSESSPDFVMSYTTVDGYKNYIKCPSCGHVGNNLEYMEYIYNDSVYPSDPEERNAHKLSYWYDQSHHFVCPSCSATFYITNLECGSCGQTGASNQDSLFFYDKNTGSFLCNNCGGSNVKPADISSDVTADSAFMVSGMSSNAVRYGKIEFPTEHTGQIELTASSYGSGDNIFVSLSYNEDPNPNKPGTFEITVRGLTAGLGAGVTDGQVCINLPGNYVPVITNTPSAGSGMTYQGKKAINSTSDAKIYVTNIDQTKGDSFTVQFTLTNNRNDKDFAFDYPDTSGNRSVNSLLTSWFGLTSASNAPVEIIKS